MWKVHLAPLSSVAAGLFGMIGIDRASPLTAAGWAAGLLYLVLSNVLLARGLHRRAMTAFGWANGATALRSTLVGLITALVVTSFTAPISVPLLVALAGVALAFDAVDGWIARSTRTETALGARFDMEVDAFLLLALSAFVAPSLGWWVLTIGMLRYAFLAAARLLPWMARTLPHRYWRKVVTAVAGIGLTLAASGWLPAWASLAATLIALALLLESFGRDVLWLAAHAQLAIARTAAGHPERVEFTK